MGLISETVILTWNNSAKKYYISKGYKFTKRFDEFEVRVEDLPDGSNVYVDCQCDECGKLLENIIWQNYKKGLKENNKYYCLQCALKSYGTINRVVSRLKNGKSFYDWCIENNRQDILDRWDYELNNCSPKDILYSTSTKYWFKCSRELHPSELKKIDSFVSGYSNIICKQCNSFEQWCIDNNRLDILNRWDYNLNKIKPSKISYGTDKKFWFKCPKGIHTSELKELHSFTKGQYKAMDCIACNSFAQWGYDNIDNEFLEKYWDYEKNIDKNGNSIDPWKISYGSTKKVYIFCQEHSYHGSYDVSCGSFSNDSRCPYCSGHKVHLYDSLGWLYSEVWSIWSSKNKKSPYEYLPFSGQKVWWKCLDGKHKDYKREISSSNNKKFRCSECTKERDESFLQEKTRLYLKSLVNNVLTEYKCTIIPTNPKTKYQLPFDNEIILINGKHLICEVMGIQHYKELTKGSKWLKILTPKEYLHKRKLYDRYKRFIAYKNGYEYLELPYMIFNKKDTYKKLINNKINEILNNTYKENNLLHKAC